VQGKSFLFPFRNPPSHPPLDFPLGDRHRHRHRHRQTLIFGLDPHPPLILFCQIPFLLFAIPYRDPISFPDPVWNISSGRARASSLLFSCISFDRRPTSGLFGPCGGASIGAQHTYTYTAERRDHPRKHPRIPYTCRTPGPATHQLLCIFRTPSTGDHYPLTPDRRVNEYSAQVLVIGRTFNFDCSHHFIYPESHSPFRFLLLKLLTTPSSSSSSS
jgi:hypothetical protein